MNSLENALQGAMGDLPEGKIGGGHRVLTTGDHPVDDHIPDFRNSQTNPGIHWQSICSI